MLPKQQLSYVAMNFDYHELEDHEQAIAIIALAVGAHILVFFIRRLANWVMAVRLGRSLSKARTIASLLSSMAVFAIYFSAIGFALATLGISVTTYLASASIIGFAVAFGSQGMVQDVVMGATILFSDLFDVGDMVEIGGQVGIVQRLGMRFTTLANSMGGRVFIPNRSIASVITYPRGYVRCLADVTLSDDPGTAEQMEERTRRIVSAAGEQFSGILRTPPDYEGRMETASGRTFLRVKFRIWPGRGSPIETVFKQEIVQALKAIDPAYADWMVAINYEVEERVVAFGGIH